ncbi:hypothetical protein ABZ826_38715 [Streptomyces sp. NPDC047515]|uniref:hypothetical protein n=1 Tax=Streptomyces sp. NPDC047515 TaxID=3155380 RepID=UPI0033FD504E
MSRDGAEPTVKPSHEAHVRKHLALTRGEDERVLAVVGAYRAGKVQQIMTRTAGDILGGATGNLGGLITSASMAKTLNEQRDAALDRTAGPDLPVAERNFLALTTGRLIVYKLGGFPTARPTKLLHDIPLARIEWIRKPGPPTGLIKASRFDIGVDSGEVARLEFPRAMAGQGVELIRKLIGLAAPPQEGDS